MSERRSESQQPEINLYEVELTPGEADAYFKKAEKAVGEIKKSPHGNILNRLRGRIGNEAYQRLADSLGILLPLSHQGCVQRGETNLATIEAIQTTIMDSMTFVAGFKGSGVKILGPDEIVPTMTSMLKGEKF